MAAAPAIGGIAARKFVENAAAAAAAAAAADNNNNNKQQQLRSAVLTLT